VVSEALIFNPRVRGNVIFGHVHMAKTAGTTLNGELADLNESVAIKDIHMIRGE
jgi:hypothetical protein